jgi:hypothetical protein
MRKPNYNMERKDRDRAKQAKAAAKLEKRQAKNAEQRPEDAPPENGQAEATPAKDD